MTTPREAEHKSFGTIAIKNADEGQIEAVFSTFNVIDHDGDVTLPGAFEDGAKVRISAFGHRSWMGELPVGRGVIRADEQRAILEGQFFLGTAAGKDTFETIKQMGELQEWSYGFDVLGTGAVEELPEALRGAQRVLTKLKVHEVSPVLLGAGIGTETLVVKQQKDDQDETAEKDDEDREQQKAVVVRELARFERTRARLLFR